jgi:hypothetical protein
MKKLFFLICLLLLAPLSQDNVRIKKNFDEVERIKQHLKTKKITVDGGDVQADSFTYEDAQTRYYSWSVADLIPVDSGYNWTTSNTSEMYHKTSTDLQYYYGSVHLPHGATITQLNTSLYRNDSAATNTIIFYRHAWGAGSVDTLASTATVTTAGWETVEDTTIANATVDNSAYCYFVVHALNPNDASNDVKVDGGYITYTVTKPLP